MNKKGFTLIEMIATRALLLLISSLVLSNMYQADKDTRQREYEQVLQKISLAADSYANSNGKVLNRVYNCSCDGNGIPSCSNAPSITVGNLIAGGFLTADVKDGNIEDPRNGDSMNNYIVKLCHQVISITDESSRTTSSDLLKTVIYDEENKVFPIDNSDSN